MSHLHCPCRVVFGGLIVAAVGIGVVVAGRPVPWTVQYVSAAAQPAAANSGDHLMFGGTPGRNMVNLTAKGVPEKIDLDNGVLWQADLGSRSYFAVLPAEQQAPVLAAERAALLADHPDGVLTEPYVLDLFVARPAG